MLTDYRHSALTDFLASNNISAQQIHEDYQRRVQEAEQETQQETTEETEAAAAEEEAEEESGHAGETPEERKKRKRKEATALNRIKQSKDFARRKARRIQQDPEEDDEDDDVLAREMMRERPRSMPGQLDNCELCGKRFTVTAYSKTGPNGGFLCPKCSKEVGDDEKKAKPKKRGPRSGRRQVQSSLLDGVVQHGTISLVETCTKKVAENIEDIDEFGDLPAPLLNRLSQILSKRRVLTPGALNLFLRPDLQAIDLYDCAKLETDDFHKVFASMPALSQVNLRFAGQLKDSVLEYMLDRNPGIKHLQLDAANLVSDSCWRRVFQRYGAQLETLKLSNLDFSFDDDSVAELCTQCPGLRRLKLKQCWKTGNASLRAIARLTALEHLSLSWGQQEPDDPEALAPILQHTGPSLRTLSLDGFHHADDRILDLLHTHCHSLQKLRLSDNAVWTDQAFARLFQGWANPPLAVVDLSATRDVDNANPDGPAEHPVGLASDGFVALMNHSGSRLRSLNIASCRHISHQAFDTVFAEGKVYPHLAHLDVTFHTAMDDYLVARIFQACPALKKLVAFACFNVRDVQVPVGVALIGGLRAQDPIVLEGSHQPR